MLPQRKPTRFRSQPYDKGGTWAITTCTAEGKPLLGHMDGARCVLSTIGFIVAEAWEAMPRHYPGVLTDICAVMPDHFHGIITIVDPKFSHPGCEGAKIMSLPAAMQRFKSLTAHRYRELLEAEGPVSLWHRSYWDNSVQSDRELAEVREYILNNPLAWFLKQQSRSK